MYSQRSTDGDAARYIATALYVLYAVYGPCSQVVVLLSSLDQRNTIEISLPKLFIFSPHRVSSHEDAPSWHGVGAGRDRHDRTRQLTAQGLPSLFAHLHSSHDPLAGPGRVDREFAGSEDVERGTRRTRPGERERQREGRGGMDSTGRRKSPITLPLPVPEQTASPTRDSGTPYRCLLIRQSCSGTLQLHLLDFQFHHPSYSANHFLGRRRGVFFLHASAPPRG